MNGDRPSIFASEATRVSFDVQVDSQMIHGHAARREPSQPSATRRAYSAEPAQIDAEGFAAERPNFVTIKPGFATR
jgi:hypothetical protein